MFVYMQFNGAPQSSVNYELELFINFLMQFGETKAHTNTTAFASTSQ